jgi:hypothetical protein
MLNFSPDKVGSSYVNISGLAIECPSSQLIDGCCCHYFFFILLFIWAILIVRKFVSRPAGMSNLLSHRPTSPFSLGKAKVISVFQKVLPSSRQQKKAQELKLTLSALVFIAGSSVYAGRKLVAMIAADVGAILDMEHDKPPGEICYRRQQKPFLQRSITGPEYHPPLYPPPEWPPPDLGIRDDRFTLHAVRR